MTSAPHALIDELERDDSLLEPGRLRERGDVLDRLETYLAGELTEDTELRGRIGVLCARLEAADRRLYESIRQDIQHGQGASRLREWAIAVGADDGHNGDSYDYLDALISGVLQIDEPDARIAELAAEMVFYQPTPARHIFGMLERSALNERDVLIDLGSGLGHVPLLAAICTGARSTGIEWEGAYVDCARRCAQALNLGRATFIQQDAREADLSAGTVFYLYTPFTGAILRDVLDKLRTEAIDRDIRICTLGPCTPTVAREPWLEAVGALETDRPALFRSMPQPSVQSRYRVRDHSSPLQRENAKDESNTAASPTSCPAAVTLDR
ncbi:histone methylation protein DOT1 [Luteibacter rhizovicinus]|uniref:Histone methylation protein DOT1 n=1 Tax=Luteibacter rhizovicinus TaxID=242606 RepID=A0A4R3YTX0_9GAMM|nr:class I SAM-dependent methyltransferase [Luteibacter rhizovicinus]TCV96407.1 histone methylation protein DOT1 [Luteibacter rhizovicinus]